METGKSELDYKAILKSVAKIEDDKYEYMVSPDQAIEAMELAVEESRKWISVDDDLPPLETVVLVAIPQDAFWLRTLACRYWDNGTVWTSGVKKLHKTPTHWKPLPAPPEILTQSEPIKQKEGI